MRPQEIVERALELSRSDGTVVLAQESSSTNLRWAGSTLTTNGEVRGRSLTVIATVDGAQGTASGVVSRSNVTADQVEALVRAAEEAAREAGPAEDARPLIDPGSAPGGTAAASWEDEPAVTTSAVFAGLAPELGAVFVRARAAGRELFGFAEHDLTSTYLGSSAGVRLRHDQPTGRLEMTGKTEARTLSSFVGQGTRDFRDVDVAALDAELTRRLGWARRSVEVAPGRHDTILPPSTVADLMVYLYWSASAREAHDGRTVFSKQGGGTRVGDRLAQLPVQLWSDPAAAGLECEPFVLAGQSGPSSSVFDNGLPLGRTPWIEDGALAALLQTRASADLTGLPVTPAVDNLLMEVSGPQGAVVGTDALVASTTDRTLLLTCLWYIREVDPQTLLLTGLTRDGVYVVEGGEVVGAATNFRFNMSPVDVLDRIRSATTTQPCLAREWGDYFTRTSMPALLVDGFNMSTVSQAS